MMTARQIDDLVRDLHLEPASSLAFLAETLGQWATEMLTHPEEVVREGAAKGLAGCGARLRELAWRDPSPAVRIAAQEGADGEVA